MVKDKSQIILALLLILVVAGHKDDDDDDKDDKACLVQAVGAASAVAVSSFNDYRFLKPFLNHCQEPLYCAWCADLARGGEWIAVTAANQVVWRKIAIQGRGNAIYEPAWVTVFHLQYTKNGVDWIKYEGGMNFKGNTDRNTQVAYDLKPFKARSVRIVVHQWYYWPCLRFGAYFEDPNLKQC